MKKCEIFGCHNHSSAMFPIGPEANVWLCQECIEAVKREKADTPR